MSKKEYPCRFCGTMVAMPEWVLAPILSFNKKAAKRGNPQFAPDEIAICEGEYCQAKFKQEKDEEDARRREHEEKRTVARRRKKAEDELK